MKDLSLLKKIKVDELPNYYLTENGKLCYKNKDNKWFYCKKVDNKPGWVWVFAKGCKGEYNQTNLAIKYIAGYKDKVQEIKYKKETKELKKHDGRYKAGVDTGAMSHLKMELPTKPIEKREKLDDTPKQKIRFQEAKIKNKYLKKYIRKSK